VWAKAKAKGTENGERSGKRKEESRKKLEEAARSHSRCVAA